MDVGEVVCVSVVYKGYEPHVHIQCMLTTFKLKEEKNVRNYYDEITTFFKEKTNTTNSTIGMIAFPSFPSPQ